MASPPLQVVFASVAAGGGHHTVRDALLRATKAADPRGERVAASSWTSDAGFDTFYRWCVKHGWQWLAYLPTRLFSFAAWVAAFTNPQLIRNTIALMRTAPPDVVVSTHVCLTAALQFARWWVGTSTRVVGVIPDYGVPDRGFFSRFALFRPDVTWVNGEDTYAFAAPRAAPGEVQLLGTLVTEDFTRVREQLAQAGGRTVTLKTQWRDALAQDWPKVAALDVTKPTVAFYGGSGFAGAARPVMDALLSRDDVGTRFNVVVLCGRDDELRASLDAPYGQRAGFATLGFLPHTKLAALYGLTDVPVMGSLAHSTLQELLETATGPLLVNHVIVGTEPPYLDYLAKHRLGTFEPDTTRMTALVLEAVGVTAGERWAPLAHDFTARAWALRDASRERAGRVAEFALLAAQRKALPHGEHEPLDDAA
jgi:UDP-N-acetylglucosamine:LPS N-acetylglucosamine transferase